MTIALKLASVIWQLTIISVVSLMGDRIAQVLHLPLPGSVVGMIMLFALLSLGIIKTSQIRDVAQFLLKHMAFFFVPITVGFINYWQIFYSNGMVLFGSLTISLLVAFLVFRMTAFFKERGE
jgi:holin-like protein